MTKDEIRAIRERAGKASEGPWESHGDSPGKPPMVWDNSGDAIVSQMPNGRPYFEPEDADFIAHARTDVPALCDAVEEARKVLRESLSIADEAGLIGPAIEVGTVDSDTQAWIDRLRAWENNLRRALGES
jgi:hypothetical protein